MLAVSVRAPLVLAGALTAGLLGLTVTHGRDVAAPRPTVIACGPAPSIATPDGVYATLKTLGDPPPEPWAPIGCNADTPAVELIVDFGVTDGVATVRSISAFDDAWPKGDCMKERVATRVSNLRALRMPVTFDKPAVRAHITVHAQDPDTVYEQLSVIW